MELMDRCLDQLYKLVYEKLKLRIPEAVVGKMAEAVRHYMYTRYVHVHNFPDLIYSRLMFYLSLFRLSKLFTS